MEFRYKMQAAMDNAARIIEEVDEEWGKLTGRRYGGLIERYRSEDAEVGLILAGSWAGDAKEAADALRRKGLKVGVIRLRATRPFPAERLAEAIEGMDAVAVVDRSLSPGLPSVLAAEVKAALYNRARRPLVKGFIAGLGGRDVTPLDFAGIVELTLKSLKEGVGGIDWFGLRGGGGGDG
jgi:pyruvate/2-oxoacid:ferredoxin oxidoreductase alpha subunit